MIFFFSILHLNVSHLSVCSSCVTWSLFEKVPLWPLQVSYELHMFIIYAPQDRNQSSIRKKRKKKERKIKIETNLLLS